VATAPTLELGVQTIAPDERSSWSAAAASKEIALP
jgi:hypothetical protein